MSRMLKRLPVFSITPWLVAVVMFALLSVFNGADAFDIPTGSENLKIKWDQTVRYNLGFRVKKQSDEILALANNDDGDRNFDKGTVTNRLDLLSELDMVFRQKYGFRVSGSFWYDQRYHDPMSGDSVETSNNYEHGAPTLSLSDAAKKRHGGLDGELLDALVFGGFDLGPVPLNVRVGRHTVDWGQALFANTTGISYSQFPLDLAKGLSVPGIEVKELYRPLGNVSAQAQITPWLSLAGQYFFEWDSNRYPEAGSYLGFADIMGKADNRMYLAPGYAIERAQANEPRNNSSWGVALRLYPDQGTEIGLFYRKFADMNPQAHIDFNTMRYFFVYPDDIDLFGISFSRQILGVSVGAELSYRHNMPLAAGAALVMPGQAKPGRGDTYGPRGNTLQGLVNAIGTIHQTPVWDDLTYTVEFYWSNYQKVTSGAQFFLGDDSVTTINKVDRDAFAGAIQLKPAWYGVFDGVDLSMPLVFQYGISGNSAIGASSEGDASWSAGLSFDILKKYTVDLAYVARFGKKIEDGVANGLGPLLEDRDMVTMTFKTTF